MAKEEQLEILRQGAEIWNDWRRSNPRIWVDLSFSRLWYDFLGKADLSRADLRGVYFHDTNLSEVNFMGADLEDAYLSNIDLSNANLRNAKLYGTNLSRARLIGADLSGANLVFANLSLANLHNARLSKATLARTIFSSTDLSECKSIKSVFHQEPSSIDFETIYRSKGKLPDVFLRGCGLTDLEIEFAKLARPGLSSDKVTDITYKLHELYVGKGIRYHSCFISYSTKDSAFAHQLHNDLQDNGVRCWFAPEDMKIGDEFRSRIDDAIRVHDKLLIILSKNSTKSAWVKKEVETAFEKERIEERTVLFPIRLDINVMETDQAWAADIRRSRHIGDFSKWKDGVEYKKGFERLLKDLKATD